MASPFTAMIACLALLTALQTPPAFDDHANMMRLLGIRALRRGPDPNSPRTYDETSANALLPTLPELMRFDDGRLVRTPNDWRRRRGEIVGHIEREVYGRIPANAPSVYWEVVDVRPGESEGIPTVTRMLFGRVDNRSHPALEVNIQARLTVPAHASGPVPLMIEFGGFGPPRTSSAPSWRDLAIAKGWGHGSINPNSIQPDNARLNTGVIGLANKGGFRKPDDWGALRAWGWGVSRLLDCFEQDRSLGVDPANVGIAGVSRYGKAALVAQAFDERIAVGLIASSGEGGTKLHRRQFGERVENLAGGLFYWMAGNFIRYGAADPWRTAAHLPVDSHQLIALCAPRPCFVSHGVPEKGDAHWIDVRGSWMAAVLASPAYALFGKAALRDPMPEVGRLVGEELAWRQHGGGHEIGPNWGPFFEWVGRFIRAPAVGSDRTPYAVKPYDPTARADANSQAAHAQLLDKRSKGKIDLYLIGDSITRRWGTSDPPYKDFLANWRANFHGWNAANFGWGADGVEHILWRLRNGELDGVHPKIIVVLAGTNNLAANSPEDIARGIGEIVRTCRQRAPRATILLTGILPHEGLPDGLARIDAVNRRIRKLAGKHVRFIDLRDKLAHGNGKLVEGVTVDGLHLSVKGYQVWADALKPHLLELLGPRSNTDLAPPPTGDPGIRGTALRS